MEKEKHVQPPAKRGFDLEITGEELDELTPQKTTKPRGKQEKNPFEGQLDNLPPREQEDGPEFIMDEIPMPKVNAGEFPDAASILSPEAEGNFDLTATERVAAREQKTAAEKFEGEFGIHPAEAETVEGFAELSEGQKLLVLENLRQLTLGRIHEEASKKYKKETAESKFLGRIWKGISKKYQIAKAEKTTAEDIKTGGIKTHKKVLEQLVIGMQSNPNTLEVTEENGEATINYVPQWRTKEIGEVAQEKTRELNSVATKFSKIPYEWSLPTASKKERKEYEQRAEEFAAAQAEAIKELVKAKEEGRAGEDVARSIILHITNVQSLITINQFFVSHPEAEDQLQKIEDPSIWKGVVANIATEKGLYFSAGFATRTVTVGMLGLAGIPIAASLMGGVLAKKRASEGLLEQERESRSGEKKKGKDKKTTERDFVNVDDSTQKLERLFTAACLETDDKKRLEKTEKLRERIDFTERKIREGLVQFGSHEVRTVNQVKLMTMLYGYKSFAGEMGFGISEKQKRLDQFLNFKEERVSKARKQYITQQIFKGAAIGAGFAATGWLARHFIGDWIGDGVATEKTKEAAASTSINGQKTLQPNSVVEQKSSGPELPDDAAKKVSKIAGLGPEPEKAAAPTISDGIVEAKKGDSVWSIAERQLEAHGKLKGLSGTERLQAIDAIKDKIEADPTKYGISSGNASSLQVGEKLNLSSLLEENAGAESPTEVSPGQPTTEKLTEEKVQEIFDKKWSAYRPMEPAEPPPLKPIYNIEPQTAEEVSSQQLESEAVAAKEMASLAFQEKIEDSLGKDFVGQFNRIKDLRMSDLVGSGKIKVGFFRRMFGFGKIIDSIKNSTPETGKALTTVQNIYRGINNPVEQYASQRMTVEEFLRKHLPTSQIETDRPEYFK